MGEFNDTFTMDDVLRMLDHAGLDYSVKAKYILTQCPTHDDRSPSAQIYRDDWFVLCHSGCGRYHITKPFPELCGKSEAEGVERKSNKNIPRATMSRKYKTFDMFPIWEKMRPIPEDHYFKGIPISVLNDLGWRLELGDDSYFIPYWNTSRTQIPFAQWRHLSGSRRFTMLKDAKPLAYGLWNLDNQKLFVVEGTSDCAVLEYCGVPFIGMPSAGSKTLMAGFADYCKKNNIEIIYAGDNDKAGDELRKELDKHSHYRVWQPPEEFKDWGDFLVATDMKSVQDYCYEELFGKHVKIEPAPIVAPNDFDNVQLVFPGAQNLGAVSSREL